jgi:hypothetical protein
MKQAGRMESGTIEACRENGGIQAVRMEAGRQDGGQVGRMEAGKDGGGRPGGWRQAGRM